MLTGGVDTTAPIIEKDSDSEMPPNSQYGGRGLLSIFYSYHLHFISTYTDLM